MFFPQPYRDVFTGGPENSSRSLALTTFQVATGAFSVTLGWLSAGVNQRFTANRFQPGRAAAA
jgi:hypothetical protein